MTKDKFLSLLFEPNEYTCFTQQPTGTSVSKIPGDKDLFFCINPLHPTEDLCPTESYHRPDTPRRADGNVLTFRNFLIELDNVPLPEQIPLVTTQFPVSSIVFSGGKSYHFIVSLLEPCKDIVEYRAISRALLDAVPQADKTTKNPSRLSRLPGVLRPDTGLYQDLVYLGTRISQSELPTPMPLRESAPELQHSKMFVSQQLLKVLMIGVDNYIASNFGGRNQFFYWLGKRCSELGLKRDEKKKQVDLFYERMQNKRNFSKNEAYMAARVKF